MSNFFNLGINPNVYLTHPNSLDSFHVQNHGDQRFIIPSNNQRPRTNRIQENVFVPNTTSTNTLQGNNIQVSVRPQDNIMCQNCDSNSAEFECVDCKTLKLNDRKFCTECAEFHPKIKQFKNHNLRRLRSGPGRSTNKRCEHGREQRDCKECGGSRICEHGRVRRCCRPCGGFNFLRFLFF